jgi:AmmeMemoRadiSam system protein B/AmmeMemoRadiSam system protein A
MKNTLSKQMLVFLAGVLLMSIFSSCQAAGEDKIRHTAVAGSFYPGNPEKLAAMIDQMLEESDTPDLVSPAVALIAPHAGYIYSGNVAAYAYGVLRNRDIERIVVLSPSHVEAFSGASVYDGEGYETPLGILEVDQDFARELAATDSRIHRSGKGHEFSKLGRGEHALEVQLPFLQRVLKEFTIVPVVIGDQEYQTCRALGRGLASLIKDDKTVIVSSSDLSHFHSYDTAVKKDRSVLNAIQEWDYYNLSRNLRGRIWEACGGGPIVAAMIAAEQLGANEAQLLKYANSGDVPHGDRSRVVGYAAFALYNNPRKKETPGELSFSKEEQKTLLDIAHSAVETVVCEGDIYTCPDIEHKNLLTDRGAFVTLKKNGNLRGCIGYTSPIKPLYETVRDVAIQAAVKDPRFPPVKEEELSGLSYDISVLSAFHHVRDVDQIKIGTHGLLIQQGNRAGLLLPQVATENKWDRITFLEHTCQKAGLTTDAWKHEDTDIFMFSAFVFEEPH